MKAGNFTSEKEAKEAARIRAAEKEGIWQQILQHFQTTQTSLSVRLVCQGRVVQQIGDIKTGVREASRMFTLQNSPQKAEEMIASCENLFVRKCQKWERVAKNAEAQERAKATGGGEGGASSAANRRRLEAANNDVRNRITNVKQCIRRLRTALNRGVTFDLPVNDLGSEPISVAAASHDQIAETETETKPETQSNIELVRPEPKKNPVAESGRAPRIRVCLESLVGDGLQLNYAEAPYEDPFFDDGLASREVVWSLGEPFCLIVQWEDDQSDLLRFKFWIVPKQQDYAAELEIDEVPELYLHGVAGGGADKLDFELVPHDTKNGPLTNEANQLLNHIESSQFLATDLGKQIPLSYLKCTVETSLAFPDAISKSYFLELI